MATVYYSIKKLAETGVQYLIPYGMRGNGKSYSARDEVYDRYNNPDHKFHGKFVYLRRWQDDIKSKEVEKYFDKKQFKKAFPEADGLVAYSNEIWTYVNQKNGKKQKIEHIGYYCALNEAERYKSWVFEDVKTIIYEEFITDKTYLDDEPAKLMHLVSTILRHELGQVILIGNTVSQINPYFEYWGITEEVLKLNKGEIKLFSYHEMNEFGVDNVVELAVEYCQKIDVKNNMFFGQVAKQITQGDWETKEYPKRPKGRWETLYEVGVQFMSFKYIMMLQVDEDTGNIIVFVYKSDREVERVLTEKFLPDFQCTPKLLYDRKPEDLIRQCFNRNKVCYLDNQTGTNFNTLLDKFRFI